MPHDRTALLFPVYREDSTAVAATIDTMCQELAAVNADKNFDVFILILAGVSRGEVMAEAPDDRGG